MILKKKFALALSVCFAMFIFSSKAFAQTPPSPPAGGPPPPPNPPPSPTEVFNKINPFKKKKADTGRMKSKPVAPAAVAGAGAAAGPTPPPGGPPPPPNPMNLFRKKRDTSKRAVPKPPQ